MVADVLPKHRDEAGGKSIFLVAEPGLAPCVKTDGMQKELTIPYCGLYIFIHNCPMTVVDNKTGMKNTATKNRSPLMPFAKVRAKSRARGSCKKTESPAKIKAFRTVGPKPRLFSVNNSM